MSKVKIYIVDDEWMAVEYLKALLKEASPTYEIVGEAFQGAMAYEQILQIKPDIIFIDIRMPVMNGLELAEALKHKGMSGTVIFLTSYRDFDFVKKGMELGIANYLLKNELTAENLKREITRIIETAEMEKKKSHMYTEHNLKKFLAAEDSEKMPFSMGKSSALQRFALIMFVADRHLYLDGRHFPEVYYDAMELEELDFPDGIICRNVIQVENGKWCGIFYIQETVADSRDILEITGTMIQEELWNAGISATFFYDKAIWEFYRIPSVFQKMNKAAEYLFLCGRKNKIYLEELMKKTEETEISLNDFYYALESKDYKAGALILQQLLQLAENCSSSEYRQLVLEIRGVLKRHCEKRKMERPSLLEMTEFESADSVRKWLLSIIREIELSQLQEGQFSSAVGMAMEYIWGHYQDNISLQDIASAVGISEGYLRKCFKNETGQTVVDYLTKYRIKRAKEIMKRREYRISEIYEKVGFTSSQYFSYVFKKVEGRTPSEYMKKL